MRRIRKSRLTDVAELNITTFMNLMVILVPFLLITAVFSRMTVLNVNLPTLDKAQQQSKEKLDLDLEVSVSEEIITLRDRNIGNIYEPIRINDNNWQPLVNVLLEIKTRYPEEKDVLITFTDSTSYKMIISIMDNIKTTQLIQSGQLVDIELFPNISIGDSDISNREISSR
ncbi:MAG: ExbD/TolR family protein [Cellvibrio sp.]